VDSQFVERGLKRNMLYSNKKAKLTIPTLIRFQNLKEHKGRAFAQFEIKFFSPTNSRNPSFSSEFMNMFNSDSKMSTYLPNNNSKTQ
jgi:hypothetical protein